MRPLLPPPPAGESAAKYAERLFRMAAECSHTARLYLQAKTNMNRRYEAACLHSHDAETKALAAAHATWEGNPENRNPKPPLDDEAVRHG